MWFFSPKNPYPALNKVEISIANEWIYSIANKLSALEKKLCWKNTI